MSVLLANSTQPLTLGPSLLFSVFLALVFRSRPHSKLNPALLDSPLFSSRSSLGQQIEQYCPAVNPAMNEWISALEELPVCEGRDGGRMVGRASRDEEVVKRVVESAKHQCGSW